MGIYFSVMICGLGYIGDNDVQHDQDVSVGIIQEIPTSSGIDFWCGRGFNACYKDKAWAFH